MDLRARDVMHHPVITVAPTADVADVARILDENGISGCPVIDHQGAVVGMISRTDLLDFALTPEGSAFIPILRPRVRGMELVSTDDLDQSGDSYSPPDEGYDPPEAQDVMAPEVIAVAMNTPIQEVARLMAEERVHRVPVMNGKELAGIITSLDLVEVLGRSALSSK